eukprot:scaffold378399_cov18-Prasinocladus_malaysianus.AAC.1
MLGALADRTQAAANAEMELIIDVEAIPTQDTSNVSSKGRNLFSDSSHRGSLFGPACSYASVGDDKSEVPIPVWQV